MTPFDPVALLVMLFAFYPDASPAALIRAHRERPEYFAGGTLEGSGPDKLRLPDRRLWDVIFNWRGGAGGPRWQMLLVDEGAVGDDGLTYDPGPLTPLDPARVRLPVFVPTFAPLVAGRLSELGPVDDQLARQALLVAAGPDAAALEAAFLETVAPAGRFTDGVLASEGTVLPSDVVDASNDLFGATYGHEAAIPDPDAAPPDVPPYDPGPLPPEEPAPPPEI